MANRAIKIQSCVFVNTPANKVFVFGQNGMPVDIKTEQLTNGEAAAFMAMNDAFSMAVNKNGAFKYESYVCPWDYSNNNAVMAQNGLFTFPTAILTASYSDGSQKQYVLGKDFLDKLTGGLWTAEKLYPYIRILLLNLTPQNNDSSTFLCKLFPPLCSIGGWIWLGLAIGATMKASNAKGQISKGVWGTGAALLWYEWQQRGGLKQLTQTVGIGKYYDDVTIRPGSRVDSYWAGLMPSPGQYGVEEIKGAHYTNVASAIKNFGLYSIEFGNWLNQAERLNFMYATLVTLRDMATVVGANQSQMGLHKKLSLAFGSRGKGGFAAAFYQSAYMVINLTKTQGRGTFCHEYGHAVDDLLGQHSGWRSTRKQPDYNGKRKGSSAWLFETVLDKVLWNDNGSPSSYQNYLDGKGEYLNRRNEIFARICETFFYMKFKELGIKNSWGVTMRPDLPARSLVEKVSTEMKQIFQKI